MSRNLFGKVKLRIWMHIALAPLDPVQWAHQIFQSRAQNPFTLWKMISSFMTSFTPLSRKKMPLYMAIKFTSYWKEGYSLHPLAQPMS